VVVLDNTQVPKESKIVEAALQPVVPDTLIPALKVLFADKERHNTALEDTASLALVAKEDYENNEV
jgi:hypothetical protein